MQNGTHERWLMDHSDGKEAPSPEHEVDNYRKFVGRQDKALALIVLFIEPSFL